MKVLFIGSDPSLFTPESPARARMQTYAAAIGGLYILSRADAKTARAYRAGVQEGNLTLMSVGGGRLMSLLAMRHAAIQLVKREGIQVISAQDPFEHGWVALQVARRTGAKLHVQIHTDFCSPWFIRTGVMRSAKVRVPLINRIRLRLADQVLPKAAGIRAVSARVRDSVVARYGTKLVPISVIPIATAVTLPDAVPLPEHSFPFALITVSRLTPEKRVEDIIDAIARIHVTYPSVGLFVVGDGPSRAGLLMRARAAGIADKVIFLGWRTDALALMRSAQAYIQASAYEGYGLTLIEAALARIPIITTDVGIVGEVFRGYEEVLVAPPGDPAALAVHIMSLIEDVQARHLLAMKAEERAKEHLATIGDQPVQIAADLTRTLTAQPA